MRIFFFSVYWLSRVWLSRFFHEVAGLSKAYATHGKNEWERGKTRLIRRRKEKTFLRGFRFFPSRNLSDFKLLLTVSDWNQQHEKVCIFFEMEIKRLRTPGDFSSSCSETFLIHHVIMNFINMTLIIIVPSPLSSQSINQKKLSI